MNVAGKRVGPAEIESIAAGDEDVVEAAAIGVPDAVKGERIVLFVVLLGDVDFDQCKPRLVDRFRDELGPTLVPQLIVAAPNCRRPAAARSCAASSDRCISVSRTAT